MELLILGSGVASSHFGGASTKRLPPAYLLQFGENSLLLECSELVRFRLEDQGIDAATIHHVALSHAHPDHCALVHFLQGQYCKGLWGGEKFQNEGISVYCPKQLAEAFPAAWNFYIPDRETSLFPFPQMNFLPLPDSGKRDLGFCTLSAAHVHHAFGKIECLAFRIESKDGVFVYSGDSGLCPGLIEMAEGSDFFLCEASASPGQEEGALKYGHLTPRQAGEVCIRAGVKTVVLTHWTGLDSPEVIHSECRASGFAGDIFVADDFQRYELTGTVVVPPDDAHFPEGIA